MTTLLQPTNGQKNVLVSSLICEPFHKLYIDVKNNKFTHYWLCGGRGSGKSTFAAACIVLGVMKGSGNAIVFRKTENKLRESVFEQMLWVIEKAGVSKFWERRYAPMELVFIPNGARILFRGAPAASRLKSIKASSGKFSFVWFEETDEFSGMPEIRSVLQSVLRGSGGFSVFYSFNPPAYAAHWINSEVCAYRPDRCVHRSTYLGLPPEWLGAAFIAEADYLKLKHPLRYKNEYLGETGKTGSEVFTNITARTLGRFEIHSFSNVRRGIDFGFAVDPFTYICLDFDSKNRRIVIFHEIYAYSLSNKRAAELIYEENISNSFICADSAEPKSIREFRDYGLKVSGAKKGRDSVYYGLKFLQDLDEIVIDPERCPNAFREFSTYHYVPDGNGGFLAQFPDKCNHTIDAVRYALEADATGSGARFKSKGRFLGIL